MLDISKSQMARLDVAARLNFAIAEIQDIANGGTFPPADEIKPRGERALALFERCKLATEGGLSFIATCSAVLDESTWEAFARELPEFFHIVFERGANEPSALQYLVERMNLEAA